MELPYELILEIFKHLEPNELPKFRLVNTAWYSIMAPLLCLKFSIGPIFLERPGWDRIERIYLPHVEVLSLALLTDKTASVILKLPKLRHLIFNSLSLFPITQNLKTALKTKSRNISSIVFKGKSSDRHQQYLLEIFDKISTLEVNQVNQHSRILPESIFAFEDESPSNFRHLYHLPLKHLILKKFDNDLPEVIDLIENLPALKTIIIYRNDLNGIFSFKYNVGTHSFDVLGVSNVAEESLVMLLRPKDASANLKNWGYFKEFLLKFCEESVHFVFKEVKKNYIVDAAKINTVGSSRTNISFLTGVKQLTIASGESTDFRFRATFLTKGLHLEFSYSIPGRMINSISSRFPDLIVLDLSQTDVDLEGLAQMQAVFHNLEKLFSSVSRVLAFWKAFESRSPKLTHLLTGDFFDQVDILSKEFPLLSIGAYKSPLYMEENLFTMPKPK